MKMVVTSSGADLDAAASPVFGRCPVYVFVDTETMAFETVENPALASPHGAGIQAAQFVSARGIQAVVTGNVGPNAFQVFQSAGIPVYFFEGGTVRQAVAAYKTGQLLSATNASAPAHLGTGAGMGRGAGRGMGTGRGMGRGRGMRLTPPNPPIALGQPEKKDEIDALKETAGKLSEQLAEVMERLRRLEEEE
jgi:predicted Fe-Mo cluster-binding NifX family protein